MTISVQTAHYMREACCITRDLVAMRPVKPDLNPEHEAVQAWPLVAPLYSGIEQALKVLLLASDRSLSGWRGFGDGGWPLTRCFVL